MIIEKIKPKQKKLISELMVDALNASGLSKKGASRLKERGKEFQKELGVLIFKYSKIETYASEEVSSEAGYKSGYKTPKDISVQIKKLQELFPNIGIGYANEKVAQGELPKGTEGWFAIPKWESIAPTYGEAVIKVFTELEKSYNTEFVNYWKHMLGAKHLQPLKRTKECFEIISKQQKGYNTLIIPAQLGLFHRGQSVRRARGLLDDTLEFGLGAFAVGIMLLTHPERLRHCGDLWIDCGGDEFAPDGIFVEAPSFYYLRELGFGFTTRPIHENISYYGSASGIMQDS